MGRSPSQSTGSVWRDRLRELFEANRRLQQTYEEPLTNCTNIQDSQLKLEQEKELLEQTIKELICLQLRVQEIQEE